MSFKITKTSFTVPGHLHILGSLQLTSNILPRSPPNLWLLDCPLRHLLLVFLLLFIIIIIIIFILFFSIVLFGIFIFVLGAAGFGARFALGSGDVVGGAFVVEHNGVVTRNRGNVDVSPQKSRSAKIYVIEIRDRLGHLIVVRGLGGVSTRE